MKQFEKNLSASFNKQAKDYDEITSGISHYIIETVDKENIEFSLNNQYFNRILDAGGGTGKWIPFLRKYSDQMILFDISNDSIEIAQKKYAKEYPELGYVCGNLENTDFEDEYFDFIFAQGGALSYTPDPIKFLKEQYRILRQNGLLWLEFYNNVGWAIECNYLEWKKQFASVEKDLLFKMPDWDYPARMFNIDYLKDALKNIRFKIINDFGTGILLNSIPRNDRSKIDLKEADKLIRIEVQLSRMQECKAGGTIFHCLLKK